jgi:hypothetical protein
MANEENYFESISSSMTPIPEDWISNLLNLDPTDVLNFPSTSWNIEDLPTSSWGATAVPQDVPVADSLVADVSDPIIPYSHTFDLTAQATLHYKIQGLSQSVADVQQKLQDVQHELSQREQE